MKLFVSALEYSANVHLCEVLREIVKCGESVELCGIFDEKMVGNLVLGMQFRTCENFQASTDSSLVESPKIFTNTKATPQSLPLRFCESQNLGENLNQKPIKSFCYFWLSPKVESPLLLNSNQPNKVDLQNLSEKSPSLRDSAKQNRGNPPYDSFLDSADLANNMRVINELKSINIAESSAYFVSCIACCEISPKSQNLAQNAQILTTHGFLNGKVICDIRGTNGFGYDPIFVPNEFNQTLGELDEVAKNALSHRASALKLMALLLQ